MDNRVFIRRQERCSLTPPSANRYNCPKCDFSASRVSVTISHMRCHKDDGTSPRVNDTTSAKRKKIEKPGQANCSQSSTVKPAKRKYVKKNEKSGSKHKSDPKIKDTLLADWMDDSDEADDDSQFNDESVSKLADSLVSTEADETSPEGEEDSKMLTDEDFEECTKTVQECFSRTFNKIQNNVYHVFASKNSLNKFHLSKNEVSKITDFQDKLWCNLNYDTNDLYRCSIIPNKTHRQKGTCFLGIYRDFLDEDLSRLETLCKEKPHTPRRNFQSRIETIDKLTTKQSPKSPKKKSEDQFFHLNLGKYKRKVEVSQPDPSCNDESVVKDRYFFDNPKTPIKQSLFHDSPKRPSENESRLKLGKYTSKVDSPFKEESPVKQTWFLESPTTPDLQTKNRHSVSPRKVKTPESLKTTVRQITLFNSPKSVQAQELFEDSPKSSEKILSPKKQSPKVSPTKQKSREKSASPMEQSPIFHKKLESPVEHIEQSPISSEKLVSTLRQSPRGSPAKRSLVFESQKSPEETTLSPEQQIEQLLGPPSRDEPPPAKQSLLFEDQKSQAKQIEHLLCSPPRDETPVKQNSLFEVKESPERHIKQSFGSPENGQMDFNQKSPENQIGSISLANHDQESPEKQIEAVLGSPQKPMEQLLSSSLKENLLFDNHTPHEEQDEQLLSSPTKQNLLFQDHQSPEKQIEQLLGSLEKDETSSEMPIKQMFGSPEKQILPSEDQKSPEKLFTRMSRSPEKRNLPFEDQKSPRKRIAMSLSSPNKQNFSFENQKSPEQLVTPMCGAQENKNLPFENQKPSENQITQLISSPEKQIEQLFDSQAEIQKSPAKHIEQLFDFPIQNQKSQENEIEKFLGSPTSNRSPDKQFEQLLNSLAETSKSPEKQLEQSPDSRIQSQKSPKKEFKQHLGSPTNHQKSSDEQSLDLPSKELELLEKQIEEIIGVPVKPNLPVENEKSQAKPNAETHESKNSFFGSQKIEQQSVLDLENYESKIEIIHSIPLFGNESPNGHTNELSDQQTEDEFHLNLGKYPVNKDSFFDIKKIKTKDGPNESLSSIEKTYLKGLNGKKDNNVEPSDNVPDEVEEMECDQPIENQILLDLPTVNLQSEEIIFPNEEIVNGLAVPKVPTVEVPKNEVDTPIVEVIKKEVAPPSSVEVVLKEVTIPAAEGLKKVSTVEFQKNEVVQDLNTINFPDNARAAGEVPENELAVPSLVQNEVCKAQPPAQVFTQTLKKITLPVRDRKTKTFVFRANSTTFVQAARNVSGIFVAKSTFKSKSDEQLASRKGRVKILATKDNQTEFSSSLNRMVSSYDKQSRIVVAQTVEEFGSELSQNSTTKIILNRNNYLNPQKLPRNFLGNKLLPTNGKVAKPSIVSTKGTILTPISCQQAQNFVTQKSKSACNALKLKGHVLENLPKKEKIFEYKFAISTDLDKEVNYRLLLNESDMQKQEENLLQLKPSFVESSGN